MSSELAIENLILISTCEKLIWSACFTKDGPTLVLPPFFGKGLYFFQPHTFFSTTHGRGHNSAGHYMPADEILILIS